MSNLVNHAKYELDITGLNSPDADYDGHAAKAVLDLLQVFADQRHSGGSAYLVADLFDKLVRFKPLGPITDNPAEWEEVGMGMLQNKRDFGCFSEDGGSHYWSVDEPKKHKRIFGFLPRSLQLRIWNKHRGLVQTIHTSKISGFKKENNE